MITSSFLLVAFVHAGDLSAKDALMQSLDNYAKLDSFSTDIEHDNSSGLFSGKYHQHLTFKKGKGFKLVVADLKGARPDNVAPDYYCNGSDVTTKGYHVCIW